MRKYILIAIGALIILGIVRIALDLHAEGSISDTTKIQYVVRQAKEAAERKDADTISSTISADFNYEGFKAPQFRLLIRRCLGQIFNVQVEVPTPEVQLSGDTADVNCKTVKVRYSPDKGPMQTYTFNNFILKMKKEPVKRYFIFNGYEWRITSINEFPTNFGE